MKPKNARQNTGPLVAESEKFGTLKNLCFSENLCFSYPPRKLHIMFSVTL